MLLGWLFSVIAYIILRFDLEWAAKNVFAEVLMWSAANHSKAALQNHN